MLKIGLDVHQRTSTCCILNSNGKTVKEKTIKGHWSRTLDYLSGLDQPMQVCFEASCGYGVIHDRLRGFAQRVVVAHPGASRQRIVTCGRQAGFVLQQLHDTVVGTPIR